MTTASDLTVIDMLYGDEDRVSAELRRLAVRIVTRSGQKRSEAVRRAAAAAPLAVLLLFLLSEIRRDANDPDARLLHDEMMVPQRALEEFFATDRGRLAPVLAASLCGPETVAHVMRLMQARKAAAA